jgi:WD40 repeat protein/serine/threonine protein kinase
VEVDITKIPELKNCVVCGKEFLPPKPDEDKCPECGGYPLDVSGWQPGATILGTYLVIGLLGEGGMGRVYRVQHLSWRIDLAAKLPKAEMFSSDAGRRKFADEAETWVKLGLHPYIVQCHYVRNIDDLPVIFSELVPSGSLQMWINDRRLYQGTPDEALARMLDIAIQSCWGLGHAHDHDLVHCDMKPANVLMTPEGIAKVADFGLVKARKAAEAEDEQLLESKVWYSPKHCSPEQKEGRELDLRTDLWSWAVSVLQMFTGYIPWYSGTIAGDSLNQYLDGAYDTAGIPDMPDDVADTLRGCLQEQLSYRPKDMNEVVRALENAYYKTTSRQYPRKKPVMDTSQHADSLNNKAISLLDLGKVREAEEAWEAALKNDPLHADVIYNQAVYLWVHGKKNPIDPDSQSPTSILRSHARQRPKEWRRRYHLALAYMAMRDATSAISNLNRALKTVGRTARHDQDAQAAVAEMEAEIKQLKDEETQKSWPHIIQRFKDVDAMNFSLAPALGGKYLVCGVRVGTDVGTDNLIRLWRIEDGKQVWALKGPRERVRSIAVDKDGRNCLAASVDFRIYACDLENGALRYHLEGHNDAVNAIAWSPSEEQAVSGSSDRTIILWDLTTQQGTTIGEHTQGVFAVAYTPEGDRVISGGDDQKICLWSVPDGEPLLEIDSPQEEIWSIDVDADGATCLTAGKNSPICLWDLQDGKLLRAFGRGDHAAFLPGTGVVVSHTSDCLYIYDLKNGVLLSSLSIPEDDGNPEIKAMAVLPDGKGIALAGRRAIFHLHPGEISQPRPRYVVSRILLVGEQTPTSDWEILLDAARARLAVGSWSKAIGPIQQARQIRGHERSPEVLELWSDLGKHGIRTSLESCWLDKTFEGAPGEDTCIAIAPDGKWAVSSGEDRVLRVMDISQGICCQELGKHSRKVRDVSISDNGRVIASVSKDGLQHWRYIEEEWQAGEKIGSSSLFHVDLSLDGRYVLTADADGDNVLWDLTNGESLLSIEGGELISLCPDGRTAAFASGKIAKLVDLRSQETKTFQADQPLKGILLAADRRHLMAFDETGKLYSWEVKTGDQFSLSEEGLVYAIAITPGAHYAVISCSAGVVLRDMRRSWDRLGTLENPRKMIFRSLAVSMNGRYVIAASEHVSLWELVWKYEFPEPADWDDRARAHLDNFLALHTPFGKTDAKPEYKKIDFNDLKSDLGYRGLGWLDGEAIKAKLEEEAKL